jgi:hypothetical protein
MNRLAILLVFLSLATACSMGCRKGAETAAKPAEDELPCDKGTDPASPAEPNLGEYQPGVVSADVKALAQGNNEFAFDLYAGSPSRTATSSSRPIASPALWP